MWVLMFIGAVMFMAFIYWFTVACDTTSKFSPALFTACMVSMTIDTLQQMAIISYINIEDTTP